MRIDIITVLPQMLEGPLTTSIMARSVEKGLAEIQVHNLRDYATNKYKSVDDYAFGGEAGSIPKLISEGGV
jgi:tRNA (guanine37-N1)-methyltransferase